MEAPPVDGYTRVGDIRPEAPCRLERVQYLETGYSRAGAARYQASSPRQETYSSAQGESALVK